MHAKSFSYFVSDLELFIRKKVRPSIIAAKTTTRDREIAALSISLSSGVLCVLCVWCVVCGVVWCGVCVVCVWCGVVWCGFF